MSYLLSAQKYENAIKIKVYDRSLLIQIFFLKGRELLRQNPSGISSIPIFIAKVDENVDTFRKTKWERNEGGAEKRKLKQIKGWCDRITLLKTINQKNFKRVPDEKPGMALSVLLWLDIPMLVNLH